MIRNAYADTSNGQVHYAECGSGPPVVLLHQTPRSWDEYREVLPLLGARHRAIAMDTIGFGASAPLAGHSIETYAAAVVELLDALNLDRTALLGHHTGGVVAVEVARAGDRVERLVLSSTPYVDASADPFAYAELEPLASRIPGARTAVIEGGMVPLMEQRAAEVADLTLDFLS